MRVVLVEIVPDPPHDEDDDNVFDTIQDERGVFIPVRRDKRKARFPWAGLVIALAMWAVIIHYAC